MVKIIRVSLNSFIMILSLLVTALPARLCVYVYVLIVVGVRIVGIIVVGIRTIKLVELQSCRISRIPRTHWQNTTLALHVAYHWHYDE